MEATERRCGALHGRQTRAEHFGYDKRMISSLNHARVKGTGAGKNDCVSVAVLLARPRANESCRNNHAFQGNDFISHALCESGNLYFGGTGDIEFLHRRQQTLDYIRDDLVSWALRTTTDPSVDPH